MLRARWLAIACFLLLGIAFTSTLVYAHAGENHDLSAPIEVADTNSVMTIDAACAGGPTIDGLLLDECVTNTFTVGGVNRTVKVYYTKVVSNVTRMVDGNPVILQHWITSDAQATQVANWFEDAWLRYFADSSHHLYTNGCGAGDLLTVQMEDGVGWSGIAYWASPGNCVIGIDSPVVRGGGGQSTVYHEAQHYLQYSYDNGCYGSWQPNYPNNSEFVEGYADLGADSVNATVDLSGYAGQGYNNHTSMYDKSYGNLFNKYFIEQTGSLGTPADSFHAMDALYAHYEECDDQDSLYVLDTVVPSLKSGLSLNELFLNFFAANWAKDWADPATQSDIIYYDDDTGAYGSPTFTQNVNMAGGSNSWAGSTPDDYAARYYQITPQAGCPYLEMEVDGAPSALLGINFMAAKTTVPRHVLRSAWIGENYIRTFAAFGAHDRLVTVVNSFANNYNFTVNATCVTPTINLLEPRQNPRHAMVGAPATPIAILARWEVLNGTEGVRGLLETNFTFESEGLPVTIVPGTFQAVGNEYWAVLLPPVRPAGDAGKFFDLRVILDGALNDTETDALLYVDPGNTDIGMVFDASGSMDFEDVVGEGKRIDFAHRAGNVIADLLRPGDRILVTDFSAQDIPAGCGLPPAGSGDGDCPYDGHTRLARTDVISPAAGLIAATKGAIANVVPLEWTPVGEGLTTAKDLLLGGAPSLNPKHIFLLSDGAENVNPLYADVKNELDVSGVVINTIGFGPESPGDLLAQIAADTGGLYRPVATTISGASVASVDAVIPAGQLGLANTYDYFDTVAQSASRIKQQDFAADGTTCQLQTMAAVVDKTATQLRFVLSAKQPDDGQTFRRFVEVLPPGADDKGWIRLRPRVPGTVPLPPLPAHWELRGDAYNDVLIVPAVPGQPFEGQWQFRACTLAIQAPGVSVAAIPVNFMMAVSVQTDIRLQGRILGLVDNQGVAGDVPTISAVLLDRVGVLNQAGTTMVARIEAPAGNFSIPLHDDGLHGDGSAGDAIFAAPFMQTFFGGGYNVVIKAQTPDPAKPGQTLEREWNGGFWIKGDPFRPTGGENSLDQDNDGMPDPWEERCKLDTTKNDARGDLDGDGLLNGREFELGTSPCDPDTDDGGERDGSEVDHGRNPLDPKDDKVRVLDIWDLRPLNKGIVIGWSRPFSYTKVLLFITPNTPGLLLPYNIADKVDDGETTPDGDFVLTGLTNGQVYTVTLQPVATDPTTGDDIFGPMSEPQTVIPKEDPDAPSGAIAIENGAPQVYTKTVDLYLSSTDQPLEGAAQSANAHQTDILSVRYNLVTGDVEVRVSNSADMAGAVYEPLPGAKVKPWVLACEVGEVCRVYAQFRDGAGNESLIISDEIMLVEQPDVDLRLFMPFTNKNN